MDHAERLNRLTDRLSADGFDALALIPGASLYYLTGISFHLMERPILSIFLPDGNIRLVLPGFEREKAEKSALAFEYFTYGEEEGAALKALEQGVSGLDLAGRKLGVEPLSMRFFEQGMLQSAAPGSKLIPADDTLSSLRMIKGTDEVAAMQRAVEIAEAALEETLPHVRVGMTELELASELTAQLLKAGSEPEMPFSPIVASGPNSALGHATPGDRALTTGDTLVLDWGASHQGYVSDITRTFFVGDADNEFSEIHGVVQTANAAGRAAVSPNTTCGEVDRAARDVIEAAGYGEYFIHRTGHGLGLEAHEPPYIRADEALALVPGMTFTVEPGIYLPRRGGVRIEDNIVVTEQGGTSLTSYPRETRVVG